LLELDLNKEGNTQILRTKKLSKRKVKDDEFLIPSDYREMSESEYQLLLPLFPELFRKITTYRFKILRKFTT
jgi:hypothetical protein